VVDTGTASRHICASGGHGYTVTASGRHRHTQLWIQVHVQPLGATITASGDTQVQPVMDTNAASVGVQIQTQLRSVVGAITVDTVTASCAQRYKQVPVPRTVSDGQNRYSR
jgi:hypothetical protein